MERKVILFDNNGVLTVNDHENVYSMCSNFLGVSIEGLKEVFDKFAPSLDKGDISQNEFYGKIIDSLGVEKDLKEFREVHLSAYHNKEEMKKLALKLKENNELFLLSNFGDGFEEVNERLWNLNEIFEKDKMFLSYKLGMAKPDKKIYEHVLEKINLSDNPEKVIFIDDNKENIDSAIEIGIDGIHFIGKDNLVEELEKRGIKIIN